MALVARIREKQGRRPGGGSSGGGAAAEEGGEAWVAADDVKLDEQGTIGAGSLGVVVRAHWRGRAVAVRQLWPELNVDEAELRAYLARMGALQHARLVRVLGAVCAPRPALLMPLAHRSLFDLVHRVDGGPLEARLVARLATELAEALAFLHARGVPHGRLHPLNVLLDEGGHAQLADHAWSGARQQITARRDASTPSPLLWAAPETLTGAPPSPASDVYSLAITLWGAITARFPYDAASLVPAVRIVGGARPSLHGLYGVWPRLLAQMWHPEPALRPAMAAVQLGVDEAAGEAHLPRHWTGADFARVDVTQALGASVQALLNAHTNPAWLGEGRDVREAEARGAYGGLQVVRVTRVENAQLWRTHVLKRDSLRQRAHAPMERPPRTAGWRPAEGLPALDAALNEAWLFHGLRPEHTDAIARHGFDERYCSLGGLYGAACYFAEMACKADQYATRNAADEFALYLTRVPLGTPQVLTRRDAAGSAPRRKPDEGFDSVVAEAGEPGAAYLRRHREFCVYDGERCYAEYLVTFRRVAAPPLPAPPPAAPTAAPPPP